MRSHGHTWEVKPGDALWMNCYHPHRYTSATRDPWEYYWVRCEGSQLDHVWKLILAAGGPAFHMVPCLNDAPVWIDAMTRIAERELAGWSV